MAGRGPRTKAVPPPSPADLQFVLRFCTAWDQASPGPNGLRSQAAIARSMGIEPSALSQRLGRIELAYQKLSGDPDFRLAAREHGKGIRNLTEYGTELYRLVSDYERAFERAVHAFGAPHRVSVRIATTNIILVHILAGAVARFVRDTGEIAPFHFLEQEYDEILSSIQDGLVDVGLAPYLKKYESSKSLDVWELPLQAPLVIICPMSHRFAQEVVAGSRTAVSLKELGNQRLFTLHAGLEPDLARELPKPDWQAGGRHVRMPSYNSILAFVRMGLGIGLVPGWPWVLREYELQGQLVRIPVPQLGRIRIAVYSPKRKARSETLAGLFRAIDEHVRHLTTDQQLQRLPAITKFPQSLAPFQHGYYVSCTQTRFPEWRRCTVRWRRRTRGQVTATIQDHFPVRAEYEATGRLEETSLELSAMRAGADPDRFAAMLLAAASNETTEALVGSWIGFDDAGKPVNGPFVLATTAEITAQGLNDIRQASQLATFLNAEHQQTWRPERGT